MKLRHGLAIFMLLVAGSSVFIRVSQAQFAGQRGINPRDPGAQPAVQSSTAPADPPPLETDLVLLTVSVTGPENKTLPLLSQDRFQVLEDGVEQKIQYFWIDTRPVSIGFLVDNSAWMDSNGKMDAVRDLLPTYLKNKNLADEYFVVEFSSFPRMTVSYTTDTKQAPALFHAEGAALPPVVPNTALNDAVYLGLESIKESANPRKALITITGGGDKGCDGTQQTLKGDQLLNFAIKQPVQIYSLLITDDWGTANNGSPCDQIPKDANELQELASNTGGKDYISPNAQGGLAVQALEIARGLKTQYLVGYKSTNAAKDGKRRGVKVKVESPDPSLKLKVWTKSGYYATKEKAPARTSK